MRKTILYIAMSLDGYIADKNGSVDWLTGQDTDGENVDTYSEFVKDIDTVVMGWKTYAQVITELSPGKWPYENLTSYIITHRNEKPAEKIRFVREDPCELIMRLRKMQGKNIWICGGAGIIQPLIKGNLIDEILYFCHTGDSGGRYPAVREKRNRNTASAEIYEDI